MWEPYAGSCCRPIDADLQKAPDPCDTQGANAPVSARSRKPLLKGAFTLVYRLELKAWNEHVCFAPKAPRSGHGRNHVFVKCAVWA